MTEITDKRISITFQSQGDRAMPSLMGWLRRDEQVAATAEIRAAPTANGSMGALEVVDVVLSNATGIAGLLLAYRTWRRAKRETAPVYIVIDGARILHNGTDDADSQVLEAVRAATRSLDEDADRGAA